jgi:hypothetical protein
LEVVVLPAAGEAAEAEVSDAAMIPKMEMHGVPVGEVISVLEAAGGTMQLVLADDSAGDFWRSYVYVFSKDA